MHGRYLLVVALVGCDGRRTSAPAPAPPVVVAAVRDHGMCEALAMHGPKVLACVPVQDPDRALVAAHVAAAPRAAREGTAQAERSCAETLAHLARAEKVYPACAGALPAELVARAEVERARQTVFPVHADPARVAQAQWLTDLRDQACGCTEVNCARGVLLRFDRDAAPFKDDGNVAWVAAYRAVHQELIACATRAEGS